MNLSNLELFLVNWYYIFMILGISGGLGTIIKTTRDYFHKKNKLNEMHEDILKLQKMIKENDSNYNNNFEKINQKVCQNHNEVKDMVHNQDLQIANMNGSYGTMRDVFQMQIKNSNNENNKK